MLFRSLRVSAEAEVTGVDLAEHAETAYDWGGLSATLHHGAMSMAASARAGGPARGQDNR